MRSYEQIYTDYCNWVVKRTNDNNCSYNSLKEKYGEKEAQVFLYKKLLKKCYHPVNGVFYFCKFIIGDLQEIGYPKPFRFNSLFRKWDKLVSKNKKLSILCARGHGKSVFFSQIRSLYNMFIKKHYRIILISASSDQAEHILGELKTIISNNEWLITKKNPNMWSVGKISYNDGYIMARGVGSEILGQHVDRIIVDDILRSDNKLSDEEIEDYVDMNLDPMLLNRRGQMIIVGTPHNEKDIFATIERRTREENSPWVIKKYPAIIDYDKKILQCPDRFAWEEIMDKRLSMGALKFGREYQLEFFSRELSLFPKKIVQPALDKGNDYRLLTKADKRNPTWTFMAGVDVARSGSVSADYTVMIVLAYNFNTQQKQIVHMWREKGLKISEQARYIAEISQKFNHCMVLVETNNMGQDMIDELVDSHNVFVEGFTTGGKGQKKDELIRFLIQAFEHEQFVIPFGDFDTQIVIRPLLDELDKYCTSVTRAGNEKFEGKGAHDDCIMSLALANKATQIGGVPFAVTNFDGGSGTTRQSNPMGALLTNNRGETDLVKMIRMGIIK